MRKQKKIEEMNKQIEIEENSKIKNNLINEKDKPINLKLKLLSICIKFQNIKIQDEAVDITIMIKKKKYYLMKKLLLKIIKSNKKIKKPSLEIEKEK